MSDAPKLILEDLTKLYGGVVAVDQINLNVPEGKFMSLLGPSGCGKTTTLRMIAGLERTDNGRIIVDGRILSDNKTLTAPERRGMGMVFQSYAVWPHMTVWDNVAYGLKFKGASRDTVKDRVRALLELVGLAQYAQRYPSQLSGGQQQRVALARALATEPSILLLDEPLSNLDALLRETMRFEIRSLQQRLGITTIYVTHAQDEALAVSDEVVVMSEGRILQHGPPEEVYSRPQSRFVAGFIGLANFIAVKVAARDGSQYVLELPNTARVRAIGPAHIGQRDEEALLMVRPENVKLVTGDGTASNNLNRLQARVENLSFTGSIVNYFLRLDGMAEPLRVQSTPPICVHRGEQVGIAFSPEDCVLLKAS
jgi:ABC-type Fe3+/spermidine/putrescine transport system ATPase subunit